MNTLQLAEYATKYYRIKMSMKYIVEHMPELHTKYPSWIVHKVFEEFMYVYNIIQDRVSHEHGERIQDIIMDYVERPSFHFSELEIKEYIDKIANDIMDEKVRKYT